MPVAQACTIIGEDRVTRIVSTVLMMQYNNQLQLKQQQAGINKQNLPTPEQIAEKVDEEASVLVQSMYYTTNTATTKKIQGEAQAQFLQMAMSHNKPSSPSGGGLSVEEMSLAESSEKREQHVPPPIRQCWRKLTSSRPYLLDKMTLIKFIVPTCAQPHAGLGGHMGLFDCLVYALQAKHEPTPSLSASGAAASGGGGGGPESPQQQQQPISPAPLVSIPDLVIFLAVCQQYWSLHIIGHEDEPDTIISYDEDNPTIKTMADWMFTVYDAYQKKGGIQRDTLHRFLSDVYGDDSYKTSPMVDQLDKIFKKPNAPLNRPEFVQAVMDTMTYEPRPSHFLLDWMATLAQAMMPVGSSSSSYVNNEDSDAMDSANSSEQVKSGRNQFATTNLSESTTVFLQTMEQQRRWLPQICDHYKLAESRTFEIKRRFHSLVESSTTVIQGDPMGGGDSLDGCGGDDSAAAPPSANNGPGTNGRDSGRGSTSNLPKHVIAAHSFYKKVCIPNDELGHGGYLPQPIAERVFESVAKMTSPQNDTDLVAGDEDDDRSSNQLDSSSRSLAARNSFWDLAHVLQFGGMCVRSEDNDESLVTWIMRLFCGRNESALDREQIGQLLLMLCDHKDFRAKVDRPRWEEDEESETHAEDDNSNGVMVNVETALAMRLLPDSFAGSATNGTSSSAKNASAPLDALVDYMLKVTKSKDGTITKDQFLKWHRNTKQYERQRLGPFVMELRLIASTLFGVPPKFATLEQSLEIEIRERHKLRYPQTDVSRRGPRGTVWYIIDNAWYNSWQRVIEEVARTSEDGEDLRDKMNENAHPRRLPRISNKGLFKSNVSLSLRSEIKWRHDYEIIPPLTWSALQAWYDGGPPIYRSVVPYTGASSSTAASPHSRSRGNTMRTENEIELYPFFVTIFLCDSASQGKARPFQQESPVSRVNPLRVLLVQLCKDLDVDPATGRLWFMEVSDEEEEEGHNDWLLELDSNIAEQRKGRSHGETIGNSKINLLLELKDEESGLWPRGVDGTEWTFKREDFSEIGDGIVGLYNMGNSCYLNSSIQCLSHAPIFRDYFTTKCYLNDINRTNPLGYEGHLAQVSAVLINSLWRRFNQQTVHQPKRVTAPQSYAPVSAPALTPKTFKDSIGKFSSHFEGNEQHDAQELLAFLLAGLSEDLNQIQNKPYIENPDSDGRPDSEMADIWWENHLKREMSIIVAMFTGQYKSLLKCRTCKYESASFEPFTFLQLPLPEDDTIPVTLIYYPCTEGSDVMKYCVRVHNNGTLYDVLIALAKVVYSDDQEKKIESVDNDGDNESVKARLQSIYSNLAKNMVVVDMREGFIFKIAPNAWRLPDLQNKETGELPLLHIYALDPLPEVVRNKEDTDDETDDDDDEGPVERADFLALAQRRSELVSKDLLHPLAHRVFGTPLLLRVSNLDSLTGGEVYDVVASHLKPIVHPGAISFLENGKEQATAKCSNEKEIEKEEIRQNLEKTLSNMEEVSAGHVPRYGFRLRITSRDGRRCAICPWYECCIGCFVPDNDSPTVLSNGDSIVVDWHFAVDVATSGFGTRASQHDAPAGTLRGRSPGSAPVKNHPSSGGSKNKGKNSEAITLEDCLEEFSKEEKIPETYCSKCKDFRLQTKRMSLWRLPPVVIIHLKRFQFTQHMKRKLRDFVDFPVDGLDLSRIMAADSVGNPGEKQSMSETSHAEQNGKASLSESDDDIDNEKQSDSIDEETDKSIDEDSPDAPKVSKRMSKMNSDDGRGEMLYDLYAVIHHQGAMAGGHYVASIKSETDGQWRMFNDAQIFEIHSRDLVDSSAYILFYIRRDVSNQNLSNFWDVRKREGEGMTEEEMDSLIKGRSDRCVIS
eukprot:CAMPEP_0113523524 /NCGR_PEP_ID=MMETSP0014_2-20120614/45750_1 /TAXON_ID=2857 /ORGANISM="Nitzschia sp." /LENGTH=1845 /DNA_ID=CAMNT_0000421617 /DNA_START=321 /DNA_END=5858 /DNA_ORIENTATION=+ /assembly_acc=CAM_ASM_000159